MPSILHFRKYAVSSDYVAMNLVTTYSRNPAGGATLQDPVTASKIWLEFSADLTLASDPNDPDTERSTPVGNGGVFMVDVAGRLSVKAPATVIWAKSVTPQNVLLCWIS